MDMMNPVDEFLKVAEVADQLSVSDKLVYRWIKEEKLPALKVGSLTRIRRSDLDAFIEISMTMQSVH